jgi:hypothetical protein
VHDDVEAQLQSELNKNLATRKDGSEDVRVELARSLAGTGLSGRVHGRAPEKMQRSTGCGEADELGDNVLKAKQSGGDEHGWQAGAHSR